MFQFCFQLKFYLYYLLFRIGLPITSSDDVEEIRKSILTGYLTNTACKMEDGSYRTIRGSQVLLLLFYFFIIVEIIEILCIYLFIYSILCLLFVLSICTFPFPHEVRLTCPYHPPRASVRGSIRGRSSATSDRCGSSFTRLWRLLGFTFAR